MIKNLMLLFAFIILTLSPEKQLQDADAIIEKAIEVAGGKLLENSVIGFDFRDKHYSANRHNGEFSLSRLTIKSSNSILDILSNNDFKRFINKAPIPLEDSMSLRYSASVNSVHYFSVLPYGLNGSAVNRAYLGKANLKGKDYYKIKITFNQEGGGEDFEDVFIYWIDIQTYKVDYLAYSYSENHGFGLRFREAYNERYVKGVRFVDYNNYKPKETTALLEKLDTLFELEALQLLSKIETKNIEVAIN